MSEKLIKDIDLNSLFSGNQMQNESQAKAEIVKSLMDKDNVNRVTELDNYEIGLLAQLAVIQKIAKNPFLEKFGNEIKELKISHERKGRNEVVELGKTPSAEEQQKSRWKFWI